MANAKSQRLPCNYFWGTSREAAETNLRLHYLAALHLFLHQRGSTKSPDCIRTAENPQAARQFHPLTTHVFEKPKAEGGLGSALPPNQA